MGHLGHNMSRDKSPNFLRPKDMSHVNNVPPSVTSQARETASGTSFSARLEECRPVSQQQMSHKTGLEDYKAIPRISKDELGHLMSQVGLSSQQNVCSSPKKKYSHPGPIVPSPPRTPRLSPRKKNSLPIPAVISPAIFCYNDHADDVTKVVIN